MKIKKITVTEKNIYALAGRIKKFFNSLEEDGAYDYGTRKWYKKDDYKYYFTKGVIEVISQINIDNTKIKIKPIIRIYLPVKYDIRIGDKIHLDGNHFIYQGYKTHGWYRMHERKIIKEYDAVK